MCALKYVQLSRIPLVVLTIGTNLLYTAAAATLAVATVIESVRVLALGVLLALLAGWIDRVRSTRFISMRYSRIVSLWQEDVTALQSGEPRPDLKLLNMDDRDGWG